MSNVIEINSLEELAPYRLLWKSLFQETPRASYFQSFEWLQSYWRHHGADQKLRVLIPQACGKPIGIVPLCIRRQNHRLGSIRVLNYPLDHWGNWYGPIGRDQAASMMLALQHLRRTPRDWDRIALDWNGPAGDDGARPGRAMRIAGYAPTKQISHTSSCIDISGSWEEFLAAKPAKRRRELRRRLQHVFKRDDVHYIRHRPAAASSGDGDPRWDLYEQCLQVAARSWQANSPDGNTLSSASVCDFLRDAHQGAARLGMVDMNLLTVGSQPAAFCYNYHTKGRLFGLRIGYDPQFRSLGVGGALLLRVIQDSFERGDVHFDLGDGRWRFKRGVCTHVATGFRLTHSPLVSLRSQAVRLGEWTKGQVGRQSHLGKGTP